MSLLSKLTSSPAARTLAQAAQAAEHAAASKLKLPSTHDVLEAPRAAAEAALQKLFGPEFFAQAHLPPYRTLPPQALATARANSTGLTNVQRIARDGHGGPHEPVTLSVSGTQAELQSALEKAGWLRSQAQTPSECAASALALLSARTPLGKLVDITDPDSPMSTMYLEGKPQVMAFEKNDDHHMGRDHLRVFATGEVDAQGRPVWDIAASRDLAFELNTKTLQGAHKIDHHVDRERDQVMADLLGTGQVASWQVAKGQSTAAVEGYLGRNYPSDGDMYLVSLAGA